MATNYDCRPPKMSYRRQTYAEVLARWDGEIAHLAPIVARGVPRAGELAECRRLRAEVEAERVAHGKRPSDRVIPY